MAISYSQSDSGSFKIIDSANNILASALIAGKNVVSGAEWYRGVQRIAASASVTSINLAGITAVKAFHIKSINQNDGSVRSFALSITTAAGTVLLPATTEIMIVAEENDDISALAASTQASQDTLLEIIAIGD